ncbi:MAG: protein kinase [Gemmatimonadales bacterium]|nr:protein kinase [Gemmatimonadales bacterium]
MALRGKAAEQLRRFQSVLADRYAIEGTLGTGGMATVYLARDLKHRRKVALKVLHPELVSGVGPDRFLREIQIAANLAHPHIVTLIESGEAGGFLYYAMPLIEGESLRERVVREGPLPVNDCVRILRDIADALAYAHGHGVVHRDIKPGNILLSGQHALVTDFGVAKALHEAAKSETLTTGGLSIGTPAYTSPEQAAADPNVDHRTDIYSIGALAYEILTGRPPFVDLSPQSILSAHVTQTPVPVSKHRSDLPPALADVVMKCLEKDPADRYQRAEKLAAELEALATPTKGTTLTSAPITAGASRWRGRRLMVPLVAVLALGAVAIGIYQSRSSPDLDPDVIAVAPFDVLGAKLDTWREGMVDLLSASLDGAGPLKTVSPSAVIKEWNGRTEPRAAAELGANLGAGLVVYGRLVAAGNDSARVAATLYNAVSREIIAEFSYRDLADRVDRLADSLALRIMGELSQRRPLGVWRLASLGASSPAALKEFLRGEQHYRRFELDSAKHYYERAIELDSTFALAHNRRAYSIGWSVHYDPEYIQSLLRAGAFNHGLARRESLLVVADSLDGAMSSFVGDSASWTRARRIFTTLEYAVQEYPLDPQVWYKLGEVRYHRPYLGATPEDALRAFARAVALDSAFVPAYKHLAELTLLLEGPDAARPIVQAHLARGGSGELTEVESVTAQLLDPGRAGTEEVQQLVEGLSTEGFYQVWYDLKWWPDSAETASRVARAWATGREGDTTAARVSLAQSLSFRGHLREAYDVTDTSITAIFAELARWGAVPPDTARAVFDQYLRDRYWSGIYGALPFWAASRDTASLRQAVGWWDSLQAAGTPQTAAVATYFGTAARAHLAVARGDSAGALELLEALPTWPCYSCYHEEHTRARLLAASGRHGEAVELLDRMPFHLQHGPPAEAVLVALERGRIHERLGNVDDAIAAFSFVINAWRSPDPELEPFVEESRTAIARLTSEPRR